MSQLAYEQFMSDKGVKEAQNKLIESLIKYQSLHTKKKKANPKLVNNYEKLLKKLSTLRGGNLFYPYIGSGFGNGALVELADGSMKYDFISGIGSHFGHSHPKLVEAAIKGALEDVIIQGNLQHNQSTVDLLEKLIKLSGLDHCFLTTSGAMAGENGLKIMFQKHQPASRILAFKKCFMGRTLAIAQITDKPKFRQGLPQTLSVDYVPFYDEKDPKNSTKQSIQVLNEHINRYPNQYAGMIFELIQGEGGYYPGTSSYFKSLMKICKAHNMAVYIDEIQTFGRTPQIFAYKTFGLEAYVDIVTIGKLSQICATLFKTNYKPKPGLVSQTFTSSSTAIRAAKVILDTLSSREYSGKEGKIKTISNYFQKKLMKLSKKYPKLMKGPFGYGTMIACTVFDGSLEKVKEFLLDSFNRGVICFSAGQDPIRVRYLVPIGSVTLMDIDKVCEIIEKSLCHVGKHKIKK